MVSWPGFLSSELPYDGLWLPVCDSRSIKDHTTMCIFFAHSVHWVDLLGSTNQIRMVTSSASTLVSDDRSLLRLTELMWARSAASSERAKACRTHARYRNHHAWHCQTKRDFDSAQLKFFPSWNFNSRSASLSPSSWSTTCLWSDMITSCRCFFFLPQSPLSLYTELERSIQTIRTEFYGMQTESYCSHLIAAFCFYVWVLSSWAFITDVLNKH